MPKRFTDSEKWVDKWFRPLSVEHKLGWNYLCDSCDCAGVIELDPDLANFQIGAEVDWDDLIEKSGGRIEKISTELIWLTKFVEFQYGELKDTVKPHQAVIKRLEKRNLYARVLEGQANPLERVHSTPKDKDKEKEKEKGGVQRGEGKRLTKPTALEVTAYARERGTTIDAEAFVDHYESNGWKVGSNRMKDWKAAVRNWIKRQPEFSNANQNGKARTGAAQNSRRGSLSV